MASLPESQPSNLSQPGIPNATSCEGLAGGAWAQVHGLLPGLLAAVCTLGLVGNLLVLGVLLLPGRRLRPPEIYLANLAASDLVFVLGLPFWAWNVRRHFDWPFGGPLCRLVSGTMKANLFVSIFLVVAISHDRYRALVYPVASRRQRRRRRAQATCLLVWLLGGLLSVPTFLLRATREVPELAVRACVLQLPNRGPWHVARLLELTVLGFLLPLAALLFFNSHILASLRDGPGIRRSGSRGPRGAKSSALILALVAAFLVCWAPYHTFAFLEVLLRLQALGGCSWENFTDLGLQWANGLAFLNSCLNPVIYVFVGRLFRARVSELWKWCAPLAASPYRTVWRS
ncbi:B1 bradykinin receptor [Erinaceus europaeus]|uniref:B1 bradykinin receptor n=1 Tax=Erinaceus europaeus TaxID=9365 RepID=A0A1S3A4D3_ERIEU|nr:B1 bradykinin receptor [Erinaceus europaeus]